MWFYVGPLYYQYDFHCMPDMEKHMAANEMSTDGQCTICESTSGWCNKSSLYKDVRSKVRICGYGYSEAFYVGDGCSLGLCPEPTSLQHCVIGSTKRVPHRLSMGAVVRR